MIKKTTSKTKTTAAKKPAVKKVVAPKKTTAVKKVAVKKTTKTPIKKVAKTPLKTVVKKKTTVAKKVVAKKNSLPKVKEASKTPSKKTAEVRPLKSLNDGLEIALLFAQGMVEKKAEDIKILDMRNVPGASTNFLVISHAQSGKQVEAIADSAEDVCFAKTKERPWHREGFENLEWVLLDYINVVVHVFQKEKRGFYAIEDLWKDAVIVPFKGK
ncbi:MAG: ribosome silencing factor [Bacteroidota bacterium]